MRKHLLIEEKSSSTPNHQSVTGTGWYMWKEGGKIIIAQKHPNSNSNLNVYSAWIVEDDG